MDKAELRLVPTACDPSVHPATMAIDSVPHHLAHEPADRLEACHPVELGHPKRSVVAVSFIDQPAALLEVRLAAAGRNSRIRSHLRHQNLEIAWRQAKIEVELAEILIIIGIDSTVAGIECLDDTWTD